MSNSSTRDSIYFVLFLFSYKQVSAQLRVLHAHHNEFRELAGKALGSIIGKITLFIYLFIYLFIL